MKHFKNPAFSCTPLNKLGHLLHTLATLLIFCLLGSKSQIVAAQQDNPGSGTRPNIVLIMADDMGYSDIACYGGEIHTPTLDQLAQNGIRFTQFYNTARCCPTRASLMTGLYPHQAGVGWMMADNGHDGYRGDLNRHCLTIAEVLKTAGYSTYMAGKWHVTKHVAADGPKENWPRQRGFDRFYGTIHGAGSFYDPNSLTRDNTQIVPDEENFYYTDAISHNAVKFIDEHSEGDPFFLYVAFTAPHWPMHALPEDIERYRGRYDTGWDAIRSERYHRMVQMGLIDENWELSPRDETVPPWPEAELKNWHRSRMEVYAAMIDRMDFGIGQIVAKLKEKNQFDNTLILFLADNGGCAEEYGSQGPLRPDAETRSLRKPMGPNELQTKMQPDFTRDGLPVRTGEGVIPGPADTYVAYGRPWANVSNTPFRMYKHWVHEGGISSPLIAHWPANIHRHGEFERQPGHLIDIMATCVDVANATYPTEHGGQDIYPLEGLSLLPAFAGQSLDRDAIYWEHEGNRAVRQGKWKLVAKGEEGPWELYDIEADRSELHDLAEEFPDRTQALAEKWEAYAQRAFVYPLRPYANKSTNFNREQLTFTLNQGDQLARDKAPYILERSMHVAIQLQTDDKDGVVIAQGGSSHGYALYLRQQRLHFVARRGGKAQELAGKEPLTPGKHAIEVQWTAEGKLVVTVDEVVWMQSDSFPPLISMPIDGLEIGQDLGGAIGQYDAPFQLEGEIQVELTLSK